jgi:hypothetical protein
MMVGNPVAKATAWCRAEPGDLYAATCIARRLATPESADVSVTIYGPLALEGLATEIPEIN